MSLAQWRVFAEIMMEFPVQFLFTCTVIVGLTWMLICLFFIVPLNHQLRLAYEQKDNKYKGLGRAFFRYLEQQDKLLVHGSGARFKTDPEDNNSHDGSPMGDIVVDDEGNLSVRTKNGGFSAPPPKGLRVRLK